MKNSEKKNIFGNILNTILPIAKTAVSGLNPLIGMAVGAVEGTVKAVKTEKEKNIVSVGGGEGKPNYQMLMGQLLSALIIIGGGVAVAMGWLTFEDVKSFIKLWNSTQ
jgi:hypothetical protein